MKRKLNRREETSITKRTRFEKLASIINKRYIASDSDDSNYGQNADDNEINLEVDEEENIISNNENDFSESSERYENMNIMHSDEDLSTEVGSVMNITDNNVDSEDSRSDLTISSDNSNSDSENNTDIEEERPEYLQFTDENERGQYVVKILREWVQEGGIMSMRKLNSLLEKLHRVFPIIPLSYKTLLQTPSQININEVSGGELWYKGIACNLDLMNLDEYLQNFNEILIDINIDGLPLFKSSSQRFWPILGKLVK